jgi:aerobic-type carbon monoxide dehydrogenase small subunit (CoxS/CutS family)
MRATASPVRSWRRSRWSTLKARGAQITDADLDSLRNICRCGIYPRIREAVVEAATSM